MLTLSDVATEDKFVNNVMRTRLFQVWHLALDYLFDDTILIYNFSSSAFTQNQIMVKERRS